MHGPNQIRPPSKNSLLGAGCPRVLKENSGLQVVQLKLVKLAV